MPEGYFWGMPTGDTAISSSMPLAYSNQPPASMGRRAVRGFQLNPHDWDSSVLPMATPSFPPIAERNLSEMSAADRYRLSPSDPQMEMTYGRTLLPENEIYEQMYGTPPETSSVLGWQETRVGVPDLLRRPQTDEQYHEFNQVMGRPRTSTLNELGDSPLFHMLTR